LKIPPQVRLAACLAGACFYMGGMVLNDLADRNRDVYLDPDRPLVQHPGLASQAWGMVLLLFAGGLLLASVAGVPLIGAIVAAFAVIYDLGAKKTFPADAVTLGGARSANLAMGIAVAGGALDWSAWTLIIGYGVYIAGVTGASRTEDFKERTRRRQWLSVSVLPMLVGCGAMSSLAHPGGRITLFLLPAAALVVALLYALKSGTRESARGFVLRSLLCIFLLHGVLLWTTDHLLGASIVAALAGASLYLLRLMKPEAVRSES